MVHWYTLLTIVGEATIASGASEKKFGHYIAFWLIECDIIHISHQIINFKFPTPF